ncbi:MAG: hypothetical protein BWX88_03386 [Planctomycetes bacterium ADurb.Bin126]|nr:MAG: hypothetical protein BWX88_03386 [Planctomycetes bacterium ADurb.Bin126]HOD80006.1 hypothetical protein [Phycisphaerae bacterium]HQL73095.1 hypothetical protein [Phycisphaerae bacterium]
MNKAWLFFLMLLVVTGVVLAFAFRAVAEGQRQIELSTKLVEQMDQAWSDAFRTEMKISAAAMEAKAKLYEPLFAAEKKTIDEELTALMNDLKKDNLDAISRCEGILRGLEQLQ